MDFLGLFKSMAQGKSAKIGLGLGEHTSHNEILLEVAIEFVSGYKCEILLYGTPKAIEDLSKVTETKVILNYIFFIPSETPEKLIVEDLIKGKINGIVRGSLSSNNFLKELKKKIKIPNINRLTLMETFDGYQFFYGPVGIDECNNFDRKKDFIEIAIKEFEKFKIIPKISILSGGRIDDLGRDPHVDDTIKIAEEIVKSFQNLDIFHDEILIENAIQKKSNLIIAPDGISGNLIYRTLVHLGGGKAYGAIYMGIEKIILDTSRVGKDSEILGALTLALALSN